MTDHQPTRACPHRLCGLLHGITAIAGLGLFIGAAATDPTVILLLLAVGLLIAAAVYRLLHKQTMTESVHEAIEGRVRYEVRSGWATAAVTIDAILAAGTVAFFVVSCLTWQDGASDSPVSRSALAVALLGGVAVTVTDQLLHRKAIRIVEAP
ncbi:hypothetical protein ACFXGR_22590 [Streptomyces mirabilis]|uniref:hypothetical protein n=1 Tax=Streptomyces mirabilis TaxID=68239 RepID=UPI00369D47B9